MPNTKLRASCDACHFAKVKCNKTEQGCKRCSSLGEKCYFSPALPRHYQRRGSRKPSTDLNAPRGIPRSRCISNASSREHGHRTLVFPTVGPSLWDPPVTAAHRSPIVCASTPVPSNQDFDIFSNHVILPSWPDLVVEPGHFGSFPEMDHQPLGLKDPYTACNSTATPSTVAIEDYRSIGGSPMPSLTSSDGTTPGSAALQRDPFDTDSADPLKVSQTCKKDPADSCACYPRLLAAMRHVEMHATVAEPALDSTLCANRAAAEQCNLGTNAGCDTGSPCRTSCWLITYGLLDLMITGYEKAINGFCRTVNCEVGLRNNAPDREESEGKRTSTALQLRLGNFAVETRDQVDYTKRIVAMEIEKLRKIVLGSNRDGGDGSSIGLMLRNHLIRRCDDVVRDIIA